MWSAIAAGVGCEEIAARRHAGPEEDVAIAAAVDVAPAEEAHAAAAPATESATPTESATAPATESEPATATPTAPATESATAPATESATAPATESATPTPTPTRTPSPSLLPLPSPRAERALRERLATAPIVAAERGHGGRSLAFRVTLEDGTRAYFKPEQTFSGTHWYAEIAAHHLDRALGLGRTPVVVGRRVAWSALEEAAEEDPRIPEIMVAEDGTVRGAMVAWIEERLVPLRAPLGWERWVRIDAPSAITPFQNARAWHRARATLPDPDELEARDEPSPETGEGDTTSEETDDALAPDVAERPSELSDLVLFDYLVHNVDRWSTSSTNVRTRGAGGPLVFLDQAAGFSRRRARLTLMDERLGAVQRFRRSTVDAVRALDLERYAAALDRDPLAPILEPRQLEHLAERRQALLDHVDALVAEHGEETVYAW